MTWNSHSIECRSLIKYFYFQLWQALLLWSLNKNITKILKHTKSFAFFYITDGQETTSAFVGVPQSTHSKAYFSSSSPPPSPQKKFEKKKVSNIGFRVVARHISWYGSHHWLCYYRRKALRESTSARGVTWDLTGMIKHFETNADKRWKIHPYEEKWTSKFWGHWIVTLNLH